MYKSELQIRFLKKQKVLESILKSEPKHDGSLQKAATQTRKCE